jgi:hypothetical protein
MDARILDREEDDTDHLATAFPKTRAGRMSRKKK